MYGVFVVFAAAPNGGYAPGGTLDPDCAPGDTDCIVKAGGIAIGDIVGNNPDLNGILYTDADNKVITDSLFTRDAVTHETNIGKDFTVSIPVVEVTLAIVMTMDPNDVSGPFSQGDQLVGATSGATATIENYNNVTGFAVISNLVGDFQQGETINNTTAGETAIAGQTFSHNSFIVGDQVNFYNAATQNSVATGIITDISGGTYTVQISAATGTPAQYDLMIDGVQNGTKIWGMTSITTLDPASETAHGGISIGNLFGGFFQGVGMAYSSDDGNHIALHYVGQGFNGGNTYSSATIVGDISHNNFANISQDLVDINGLPTIQLGTVDTIGNHNSNIVLNGNRMILQNNQEIALLGRVQIGEFDYDNDTDSDPFPAFPGYYYLPQSRGAAGQVMTDDGDGNLYWSTPTGSGSLIGSTSTVSNETWLGSNAGGSNGSAGETVFLGINAGYAATDADHAVFLGRDAGREAVNANDSNFFGYEAGYLATDASYSNFMGNYAGNAATNADQSNFFGTSAGYLATNAANSNFLGTSAGTNATDAHDSNFFGQYAGYGAYNADNSNFFGYYAGQGATDAVKSTFIGEYAGYQAANAWSSVFVGDSAGRNSSNANRSNFFGSAAGWNATNAQLSNFFGGAAGMEATDAANSNFFGYSAGFSASNAANSNFFGNAAGYNATNSESSNFFGNTAGQYATNALKSNFFGFQAGYSATSANNSNFFGDSAGMNATNASYSNFFGPFAGGSATNASNSIFIGRQAGFSDSVDNTGDINDFSILIGQSTSTGGFSNSIAIGGSATNTASNQFMIGSSARPVDTTVWKGSAGTECTLTTGTGVSCTSDERLKTNIVDLTTDTLDKLLNVKTVTYNWIQNPDSPTQIGFLAQDLEQYFPELVATNSEDKKSVYYSQITPILVEAIREMNLKITDINNMETPNMWRDSLIAWFGNTANGITDLFTKRIHTDELCVGTVCVTQDQFLQMVNNSGTVISGNSDPIVTPDPLITPDDTTPTGSDPVVIPDDPGDSNSDTPTE